MGLPYLMDHSEIYGGGLMKKQVALTFDDGPNTVTTPKVLDLLEKYNIKASFFLIGQNVTEESKKVAKRAISMGCDICNHSFTHPFMSGMNEKEVKEEIEKTDAVIEELTGKRPLFFRPPYIDVKPEMYDWIPKIFISGIGCLDWEARADAEYRKTEMLKNARDGVLYLLHDFVDNDATVEALKTVIPTLLEQDYEFLTVTEIFKAKQPLFNEKTGYEKRPRVLFSDIINDYK